MKRTFTRKERLYLAILAGFRCEACGVKLCLSFHGDHVQPYSYGGATLLSNGQALCANCNLMKGNNMTVEMSGIPPLRDWQKIARQKALDSWRDDPKAKVLIASCPGSGKTLFAAMLVRELLHESWIEVAIVLAPTTNIQLLWVKCFDDIGIKATDDASNYSLRWRKEAGVSMIEDNKVLVLTYSQVARDPKLIAELARRAGRALLIGDEIHHADDDEKFGDAVAVVAEKCAHTLALSGTPFNSTGGALVLCESITDVDPVTSKPVRRTIPTHPYSYGEALEELVCRSVEFIKVFGRGEATYQLLSNASTFKRITDLAQQRKADRISILLDPDGEFMEECARQAVRSLAQMRAAGDRKAAMLVVAKTKDHGAQMAKLLHRICEAENQRFFIQEIYNDTPKAHDRIEDLKDDTTDIIVSVRMISEGVDIKRLRVGLFATDWMTRMFFIQFIGRFVRYEDRLDKEQFAHVIIPAHVLLLEYALEIEKMIETAVIPQDGGGPGGSEKTAQFIGAKTAAGTIGVIHRGVEFENFDLAEALYKVSPSARGKIAHSLAIMIAEELGLDGANPEKSKETKIDWGNRNDIAVRAVVKRLGRTGKSDDELYSLVQDRANKAVGIVRKDKMTAEATLIKRHAFLQAWLRNLISGQEDDDAA